LNSTNSNGSILIYYKYDNNINYLIININVIQRFVANLIIIIMVVISYLYW